MPENKPKRTYEEVQAEINFLTSKKKEYQKKVSEAISKVESDPDKVSKLKNYVYNLTLGADEKERRFCIGSACYTLNQAGELLKYTSNALIEKDITSGKLKGYHYDYKLNDIEPGDILQLNNKTIKGLRGAPSHGMLVKNVEKDKSGNVTAIEYYGSQGSAESFGTHRIEGVALDNYKADKTSHEVIKKDFIPNSLYAERDMLKPFVQPKVRKDLDYEPNQSINYLGSNDESEDKKKNRREYINKMMDRKEELMRAYNLSNNEYNDLVKLSAGILDQESEYGTSARYKAKSIPGVQFVGKLLTGNIKGAFDEGDYSSGPGQSKPKYFPSKAGEKFGITPESEEATLLTVLDRYSNQVPSKLKGTPAAYLKTANVYKGMSKDNNDYAKSVLDKASSFGLSNYDQSKAKFNDIKNEEVVKNQNAMRQSFAPVVQPTNFVNTRNEPTVKFKNGGWLDGTPSVKPNFQTIWDTDKDILEFRRVFKERFGEEPGTEDGGVYNIQEAVLNGERPKLDKSDGLYHWSDKYKLPNHPTFSNQSKYYKPGMKAVKWVNEEPVNIETQNYTGSKALKIQGKSTGYVNIGDGTGRKEVKKFGGWLDSLPKQKFDMGGLVNIDEVLMKSMQQSNEQSNNKNVNLNYKKEPAAASTTSVNNNVAQQKAAQFAKDIKNYGTPEKALAVKATAKAIAESKVNQGTLSKTQSIDPNNRWMIGAANYKGDNPEQVVNMHGQTQAIGAMGAGVVGVGSIPVVSQTLGAGFAAKGVHDIPKTVRTVADPNVSLHDKAKAVTFNAGDFLGVTEGIKGAKKLGDFANKTMSKLETTFANSSRPVNRVRTLVPQRNTPPINQNSNEVENDYLNILRGYHHNNTRSLSATERRYLRDNGYGQEQDYLLNRQVNNNQMPPPPPPGEWNQVGVTPPSDYAISSSNYDRLRLADDYTDIVNGYAPRNYPNLTREQNIIQQDLLKSNNVINSYIDLRRPINGFSPGTSEWSRLNNVIENAKSAKPKNLINKSGLTKEQVIEKASSKDKDVLSKMSEQEFENTVLKPNGEITTYKPGTEIEQMTYDLGTRNLKLKDTKQMSNKEYADTFNEKLDLLNDIIAQRNKSGVEYKVKGLDESGRLTFYTPPGQTFKTPSMKNKSFSEIMNTNVSDFFSKTTAIPEGESSWGVRLNPGQWEGNVEDIANTEYFRSIPGLEMSNTTSGVFSDHIPRRGSGAYDAINEYLKKINLGRVKPGFNSQTDFSRGAWENYVNKGKAFGFYGNAKTVYGTMKSALPYAGIGGLGAAALAKDKKQNGGWLDNLK